MSGAGDHRRSSMDIDPIPQRSIDPIDISDPPTDNHVVENSTHMSSKQGTQHGVHSQYADPLAHQSTKIQEELHELGKKVNYHEGNIQYLKSLKTEIEESILQMQVTLKASVNGGPMCVMGEEETTRHIISGHEKSATALLCSLKQQAAAMSSDHSLTENIIGVVATLGKVDDENLSRLLSEYLGEETMLAVVCKTQEGVKVLEVYKEGSIDMSFGIHAFSTSIGRPLAGRFCVICLGDLRPYAGEFVADDPQRRLDLPKPRLPNGETPPGFLGFAVNMITIDSTYLNCVSKSGHGLRETLFYNLFSNLQVYRSREDMLNAIPCIQNGAISLQEGGMMKNPGVFALGRQKEKVGIKFPTGSTKLSLTESHVETEKLMKEAMWKKDYALEDVKREQTLLDNAKFRFEAKKRELFQFLSGSSPHSTQHPTGGASTPR